MSIVKYYVVTQTREVRVTANSPIDAARIGDAAFEFNSKEGGVAVTSLWGNTTRGVEVIDIASREEY